MPMTPNRETVIARLEQVKALILAEPRTFDMSVADSQSTRPLNYMEDPLKAVQSCGTVCCIAGWYHFATPPNERVNDGGSMATLCDTLTALGIPEEEVIYDCDWPVHLAEAYSEAEDVGDHAAMARLGAQRIDLLIAELREKESVCA
jgi:hypothetical protein